MAIHLQEASEADIAAIAGLARQIWNQHYVPIIGQEQVDYMLGLFYNANSLREQMLVKQHRFFMVRADGRNQGFISVNREKDNDWFINKFYIDQAEAGRGFGTKVFREIVELLGPREIRLTVNRQNYKSINFYFKNGFVIEKVADFDIGQGYVMNDFVMVWRRL